MDDIRRLVARVGDRAEAERAQQAVQLQSRQRASAGLIKGAVVLGLLLLAGAAALLLWNRARLLDTRARERLAAARLQAAVDQVRDGIAVYDASDRLILCNSRFAPLLDLPAEVTQSGAPMAGRCRTAARWRCGAAPCRMAARWSPWPTSPAASRPRPSPGKRRRWRCWAR